MIITITLTAAGADTGPFDLYSDVDGYTTAFDTGVAKNDLLAGYSTTAPDGTSTVKVLSTGICTNYIYLTVIPYTTTTSTSTSTSTSTTSSTSTSTSTTSTSTTSTTSSTSTTTTTTTLALTEYCYSALYPCGDPAHEILGHEPFTGSVTYTDEFGESHIGYYCYDIGVISVYSSSLPVTIAMTGESCNSD